jgi:hypothetical protein
MKRPRLGMYVFDLANRHIKRRGHTEFAQKLKEHKIDVLHIEAVWGGLFRILPFKRKFVWKELRFKADLEKIRPKYAKKLKMIKEIYEDEYGRKIMFGLFDHCAEKKNYEWHPWGRGNNIQGVEGIYDTSDKALRLFLKWADFIIDEIGFTLVNLYNEARYPGKHSALKNWCREIVLPLGEYIYDRVEKPIWTSGETKTAHWITGVLSPEESEVFGWKDSAEIFHVICTPDQFKDRFSDEGDHGYSRVKKIGFSTDGCGVKRYPEEIRSDDCIPEKRFCLPKEEYLIDSIKQEKLIFGDRFIYWENLDRTCDYRHIRHIKPESLQLYLNILSEVYGEEG